MAKPQSKNTRIDPDFAKILKEIQLQRIKSGRDTSLRPPSQITRAMIKHKNFPTIVNDILKANK